MEGQRKRAIALCQMEGCQTQARQKCRLCALDCCAAHGHWAKAIQIGSLRGLTPPDASLWLCAVCAASMKLTIPPDPNPRRRAASGRTPLISPPIPR
jgi:hypothetical protein